MKTSFRASEPVDVARLDGLRKLRGPSSFVHWGFSQTIAGGRNSELLLLQSIVCRKVASADVEQGDLKMCAWLSD
jgi:hypothetical protein